MDKKQKIIATTALVAVVFLYSPLRESFNAATSALLMGAAGTALAACVGYSGMLTLGVFEVSRSAGDYGKTWFGYFLFIACITRLNNFFVTLDVEYLFQFGVVLVVYGALAFMIGYVIGAVKTKNKVDDD